MPSELGLEELEVDFVNDGVHSRMSSQEPKDLSQRCWLLIG